VTSVTDERTLPAALDDLYRAVAGLVDPRKEWCDGQVLAAPSMYDWLVAEIPRGKGRQEGYTSRVARSAPTVWVDAVDLRVRIDTAVAGWQPDGPSTPNRLRALAARKWRPQDVDAVAEVARTLHGFRLDITGLLEPAHIKTVAAECPSCGLRWHYRFKDGERVRQPALQIVAETGCSCVACGAFWSPDRYLFLCKLLGFDVPAGVLE
jgi:hypothetical protein